MNPIVYLVSAFVLGALHALQPGHGKSLLAAYLVGSHGRIRDAFVLGGVITATHTASIYALGVLSIVAAAYIVPSTVERVLQLVSSLLVLGVGLWLASCQLTRRQEHHHDHAHDDGPGHHHDHGHHHHNHHAHASRGQAGSTSMRPTLGSLVALGISGGIVPCPEALVILLTAVALGGLGNILGALATVVIFSLGLATVLIALGIGLVRAAQTLEHRLGTARQRQIAVMAATGSALFITLLGTIMTARAVLALAG